MRRRQKALSFFLCILLSILLARINAAKAAANLFVDDVAVLQNLEQRGYSFSQQIHGSELASLKKLANANSGYKLMAKVFAQDISELISADKNAGPSILKPYRTFNAAWLSSSKSKFELAGVVFRADRHFKHENRCGELRLIYRLAYNDERKKLYSRMPMTAQVVRRLGEPCNKQIEKWLQQGESVYEVLQASSFFDVEFNLQSMRWPAAVRPDMGAYAEYLMRVFEKKDDRWQMKLLDNTIDIQKLSRNRELREKLLHWLKDPRNLDLVDQGEGLLPKEFLATKAQSVAVHGLNRRANRLFSQVFTEQELSDLDFSSLNFIKSPQGYLRKLDEMSCIGCHQSKSIAGFHFLGRDREQSFSLNRVSVPFSVHFWNDQGRRQKVTEQLQEATSKIRSLQGYADRPIHLKGEKNDRCYVGKDKTFVLWTCLAHLKCEPIGAPKGSEYFGICQESKEGLAGDACYFGRISQNSNAKKERETDPVSKDCKAPLECLRPSDGYPGGLCFANFCKTTDTKSCAALAVPGFNPCLAKGRPFTECLEKFTGSIEAGRCDLQNPCRDDFICAEGFAGRGVCAPPYSLFQLRVDGHVSPD